MLKLFFSEGGWLSKSGWRGVAFFAGLGVLTSLSFAPVGAFPLVFISFPLLLKALDYSDNKKRAFFVGGWFAFGLFVAGLYWVGFSFLAQTQTPAWLAPFAVIGLAGTLSIFVGLGFVLAHYFWTITANPALRVLTFTLSWGLFEWLRGHLFTGFPWHQMSHIWSDVPVVLQSVSVWGSYGLTLLTVFVASSPVLLFERRKQGQKPVFASVLLISVGVVLFGAMRLTGAEVSYFPDVRLRLVQANIPQVEKWAPEFRSRNISRHINLSTQGWGSGYGDDMPAPTHVIWSETAVPYYLHSTQELREGIMGAIGGNVRLITGVPRVERNIIGEDGEQGVRLYNSIIGLSPQGQVEMTYDKFHLVPFGEYVPFASILNAMGVDKMAEGEAGFTAGHGPETVSLSGLPSFSPLICYEVIFAANVRADMQAQWILNLTNDAWFGESFGPHQHFAQAKMRAVEEGVAVVRVAGTGVSGVIDPWGRVLGSIALSSQGYLDSQLPKSVLSPTIFAQYGNAVFWLLFFAGSLFLATIVIREKEQ